MGSRRPAFLLDVREVFEHQLVCLEGDVLIPLGELIAGSRSWIRRRDRCLLPPREPERRATAYLRHNGFPYARNLRGGIEAWAARVDPSLPRY